MEQAHATTILCVHRGNQVALGGDGQVSLGNTVMKGNARKVRRLHKDQVLAGFAGGTADAFTLFELFEAQLDKHQGHLVRAAVELAKAWRTERALRRLEALMAVADKSTSLIITGNGDVIEPEQVVSIYKSQTFPTTGFGVVYNLKPELQDAIRDAFFSFDWEGTTLQEEFSKSGEEQFIEMNYKDFWDVIRKIDAANDVSYACQ